MRLHCSVLVLPFFALAVPVCHGAETRTDSVTVVQTHVGGTDGQSRDFVYTAPSGWKIVNHQLHERSRGGDAQYSVTSATDSQINVHWRVQSRQEKAFGIPVNTITAFLDLHMTVTLVQIPVPEESWPKITAVAAGIVFVIAILVLAVYIPRPTEFQEFVFRAILSLAAGGFGAALPGIVDLKIQPLSEFQIHAAGAVALGMIVYLINPPALIRRRSHRRRRRIVEHQS